MKNDREFLETCERLSTLLDGESTQPDADLLWMRSDREISLQYRQYEWLQAKMRALPGPEIAPDFTDHVLARLASPRKTALQWKIYAVAASILFMLAAGYLYIAYRPTANDVPQPAIANRQPLKAMQEITEEQEEAFWLYLAESTDQYGMTLSLAALEEIPGETLLDLLADMESDGDGSAYTDNGYSDSEWNYRMSPDESSSFVTFFDYLDLLNEMDATALNKALRAAMTEV